MNEVAFETTIRGGDIRKYFQKSLANSNAKQFKQEQHRQFTTWNTSTLRYNGICIYN